MPEPQADPHLPHTRKVALHALVAGVIITMLKFGVFWLTNSVAVLSDALESIVNIAAAAMVLYTMWIANQPADRSHPYGHGKAEVLAVGLEGWMILFSGLVILYEACKRLIFGSDIHLDKLVMGWWYLAGVGVLTAALALYVWRSGKRYDNAALMADGKHLLTDFGSTVAVLIGLALVHFTGKAWLDAVVALVVATLILLVSWRLLWQATQGLMDASDPDDDAAIRRVLDEEVAAGAIRGYHKVRHRHSGRFHWVDMHLHVDGTMTVTRGHDLASRIEGRVERSLGQANATAHLEPWEPGAAADGATPGPATPEETPPPDPPAPPDDPGRPTYDLNP